MPHISNFTRSNVPPPENWLRRRQELAAAPRPLRIAPPSPLSPVLPMTPPVQLRRAQTPSMPPPSPNKSVPLSGVAAARAAWMARNAAVRAKTKVGGRRRKQRLTRKSRS